MNEHLDIARLLAIIELRHRTFRKHRPRRRVGQIPAWQLRAAQRAALVVDGSHIRLKMWPAELASQYKFVYSAPQKVESLVALAERPG